MRYVRRDKPLWRRLSPRIGAVDWIHRIHYNRCYALLYILPHWPKYGVSCQNQAQTSLWIFAAERNEERMAYGKPMGENITLYALMREADRNTTSSTTSFPPKLLRLSIESGPIFS